MTKSIDFFLKLTQPIENEVFNQSIDDWLKAYPTLRDNAVLDLFTNYDGMHNLDANSALVKSMFFPTLLIMLKDKFDEYKTWTAKMREPERKSLEAEAIRVADDCVTRVFVPRYVRDTFNSEATFKELENLRIFTDNSEFDNFVELALKEISGVYGVKNNLPENNPIKHSGIIEEFIIEAKKRYHSGEMIKINDLVKRFALEVSHREVLENHKEHLADFKNIELTGIAHEKFSNLIHIALQKFSAVDVAALLIENHISLMLSKPKKSTRSLIYELSTGNFSREIKQFRKSVESVNAENARIMNQPEYYFG